MELNCETCEWFDPEGCCETCEWFDPEGCCLNNYSEQSCRKVDKNMACYWWQEKGTKYGEQGKDR